MYHHCRRDREGANHNGSSRKIANAGTIQARAANAPRQPCSEACYLKAGPLVERLIFRRTQRFGPIGLK